MRVEREAIIGIGVAVVVALVLAVLWYGALGPVLFTPPSSEEVVEAFEEEGLEVGTYYDVDDEEEGQSPIPQTYVEGTRFTIPSLEEIDPIPPPPEPVLPGPDGRPVAGGLRLLSSQPHLEMRAVGSLYSSHKRIWTLYGTTTRG